jgi:hypothetical protein
VAYSFRLRLCYLYNSWCVQSGVVARSKPERPWTYMTYDTKPEIHHIAHEEILCSSFMLLRPSFLPVLGCGSGWQFRARFFFGGRWISLQKRDKKNLGGKKKKSICASGPPPPSPPPHPCPPPRAPPAPGWHPPPALGSSSAWQCPASIQKRAKSRPRRHAGTCRSANPARPCNISISQHPFKRQAGCRSAIRASRSGPHRLAARRGGRSPSALPVPHAPPPLPSPRGAVGRGAGQIQAGAWWAAGGAWLECMRASGACCSRGTGPSPYKGEERKSAPAFSLLLHHGAPWVARLDLSK